MTTNQTIDGVPREAFKWALEQLEEDGNKGCGYFDSLRALLDSPAVHPDLGSSPANHMAWLLDKVVNPGEYPVHVLHEQIRSTLEVLGKPAAQPQGEPVELAVLPERADHKSDNAPTRHSAKMKISHMAGTPASTK